MTNEEKKLNEAIKQDGIETQSEILDELKRRYPQYVEESYISGLDKSMTRKEKLFFFDKVKLASYDFIVDFGCANGRLLYEVDKELNGKNKNLRLFGIDDKVYDLVDGKFTHQFRRVNALDDLPLIAMKSKKVLLILSSVLHEVDMEARYEIGCFAKTYADTVVIRDMYFQGSERQLNREKKQAADFINNHLNLLTRNEFKIFNDIYKSTLQGGANVKKLYEFFLKYTYKQNWENERQEDYFSENVRFLVDGLRRDNQFKLKYLKHYILPYKRAAVKQGFDYQMGINTHVKVILKRANQFI